MLLLKSGLQPVFMKKVFLNLSVCVLASLFTNHATAQVSITPGAIPASDSLVVYHDVTINTAGLPAGFNRIASRGTVAGTGFSVLTDDPDTAPADSTITVVNRVPVFAAGASTPFTTCQNASAQSLNSLLTASDDNSGQTLMWTVTGAPTNGTLAGFPATASSGPNVTPAGLTYQPTVGYTGSDAFTIHVSDGFDGVSTTINVTVTGPLANNTVSGDQTICPSNTPAQLTGSLPTGGTGTYTYLWESSTTSASAGFAPAAGTNNTQNYQPGAISVPTWYRRTVTSGSCAASVSSTTVAISITNTNTWTGIASTAWSNVANWSCGSLPNSTTDVVIPAVATQPIVDVTTAAAGTLTINSSANLQFSAASSRLDVYGTIANAGTFDALPGTVGFRSSSAQNIPAGTYSNIVVNGAGNKVLDGAATVEGTLTLTSGKVPLGASNLTVGSAGSISGGSSASYIVTGGAGRLVQQGIGAGGKTGAILFPVGSSAASYTPATLSNTTGTADDFSAAVIDNVYTAYVGETPSGSPITSNVVSKTWFMAEAAAGGSNADLTLTWNGTDETAGFMRSNCQVSHYTGNWNPSTGAAATGANPYSRVRTGITSFSPFGVGSAGSPLPLELISFTGQLQDKAVQLRWETANEEGLTGFDVERSEDGVAYRGIGRVEAAGKLRNGYGFEDRELPTGSVALLYRLKIAERDGGRHYSNIVSVRIEDAVAGSVNVYPNPVSEDVLYLKIAGANHASLSITILDGAGRKWGMLEASAEGLKMGLVPVSVKGLPPGVYLLQLADEKRELQSVRFSRQ